MFQFPGFALNPYVFRAQYLHLTIRSPTPSGHPAGPAIRKVEGGFPHSEIPGSKLVRSSPRLIAAYHVLHRLSAPRHPPNALKALDRSHDRCPPPLVRGVERFKSAPSAEGTDDQKDLSLDLSKDVFACLTHPASRARKASRLRRHDPTATRPKPSLVRRISIRQTECVTSSRCQTPASSPRASSRIPQNPWIRPAPAQPTGSPRRPIGGAGRDHRSAPLVEPDG